MDKSENEESDAEHTREYLLLSRLGQKFPRLNRDLFKLLSIDLRSLALLRVVIASILLVDLATRLPDLRAFYSDDGVTPRAAVYQILPNSWFISLHFLSGRVEVEALMFLLSSILAVLLLVGFKTRLVSFLAWLLYSSLCIRNPFIVHGADSLLKMVLFWGMFVPWGARWSVDSALNPTTSALPKRVLSVGTIALLLQMPFVYFFGGILKNGLEWRHDFTAILYALRAPDYVLPFGVWLTSCPGCLRILTAMTLILEIAGALLLFCPFRTRTIRFFVAMAFIFLQVGLALTLRLGLFPAVSIAALAPFISSSFWDRLISRLSTAERAHITVYYDGDCGFCKKSLRLIKTFFLLPDTEVLQARADQTIHDDMVKNNSWIVIDNKGTRYVKFDAAIEVFRASPILWLLSPLLQLKPIRKVGAWLYEVIANHRGTLTRLTSGLRFRRLTVNQPLWMSLICLFCFVYVAADNFGSIARSPIRIPARLAPIGQVLNIHQNWKMFAPSPLRAYTWYVVTGKLADGSEVDLWNGSVVNWQKHPANAAWIKNYRWRAYMRYLGNEKQRALRPYFAGYVCRSWNAKHSAGQKADDLSFYRLDEPILLDGSAQQSEKTLLWQQPCAASQQAQAFESSN